jgi:transposase
MDKGYDNNRVLDETRERGCVPIVCLRKGRPIPLTAIPYGTDKWRRLYRGRAAVEREFGRLKNEYALTPLRTRGIERVRLHADLVMLSRLAQALVRARAVTLAASNCC